MEPSVSAILSQVLTSIICEHMPLRSEGCIETSKRGVKVQLIGEQP